MKKTKKALASLAIAGMVLTMVPFNAFAADPITRLGGETAEQTAALIADQTGYTGTAILASSASYGASDALTAGPLAAFLKAPILLQGPDAALNTDTKKELQKLNVTKVYVTSGTAVIKQSVLDELQGMGIQVESLGGVDRFETSAKIAQKMVDLGASVKKVAVAYGWKNQDALSIAAIAAAANEPIILTDKSGLSDAAKDFLAKNPGITASDVIGGSGVIDDAVLAQLPSPTRHFGDTAYDTNNKVIQDFASALTFDKVFVANGVTGIDALAGAPLAAISKSPIVLTDGVNVPDAATFVHGKMTATGVVTALGGAIVVPDNIRTGIATGQVTPPQGALQVKSVTAYSVNGIKVTFNQAPADISKVVFTVTRGTAAAAVTANWNDAKTEATLASSGNYAEGVYTVAVKNDTTDLGSSTVQITSQRVGKISIDSNVLAVTDSGKTGYVGYHVYDQYGTDITTSYLAGDSYINWTCGIGKADANGKGLLTVKPFNDTTILTQYTTAVVTAVTQNQTIPASANVTLNVSTAQGTISDITLNKITSPDNATPTVGDTEKYYIDYSAKDMAGNATNNLKLMQAGLITNHSDSEPDYPLISSNTTLVTAKIVEDPSDDQKAALEVTINDPLDYKLMQDQPITITATTYTGKTSSLTFTLKKKAALDSFTLMAPTDTIGSGETGVIIPFAAYDQAGKQLTKFSDISGLVTLSPDRSKTTDGSGLYIDENADGTAALKYDAPTLPASATAAQQENLSATVADTGKFSNISLNVDLPKKADSLKLDDTKIVPRLEVGASQALDFGYNDGGLQVLDQYGRVIDMTSKFVVNGKHYFIKATTSDNSIVKFGSKNGVAQDFAYAGNEVNMVGVNAGTATIKFELMQFNDDQTIADAVTTTLTKSLSVSVIKDKDITGYVLDTEAKPYYANVTTGTDQEKDFNDTTELNVYGTMTSGSKVVLNADNIIARTSSSSDFAVYKDGDVATHTDVLAKKLADTKTGSSTTVSVTVMNSNDNRPHTATTAITSITDAPAAQSIGFTAQTVDRKDKTTATGVTVDGNTVTVNLTGTQNFYTTVGGNFGAIGGGNASSVLNAIAGRDLTRFTENTLDTANPNLVDATGAEILDGDGNPIPNTNYDSTLATVFTAESGNNRGYIYLWAKDQYNSKAMDLSTVKIDDCSYKTDANDIVTNVATIKNNALVFNYMPTAADYIVVSGVSSNGLVDTVRIVFEGALAPVGTPQAVAVTQAKVDNATALSATIAAAEGAAAGNYIVGTSDALTAAIGDIQAALDTAKDAIDADLAAIADPATEPADVQTAQADLVDQNTAIQKANTDLAAAVKAAQSAVVVDISSKLKAPKVTTAADGTGVITGYTLGATEVFGDPTSDNEEVATAALNGDGKVEVTGVAEGTANITVTVQNADGNVIKTGTVKVTVAAAE